MKLRHFSGKAAVLAKKVSPKNSPHLNGLSLNLCTREFFRQFHATDSIVKNYFQLA